MSGYNCICDKCLYEFQSAGTKEKGSIWSTPPSVCPECGHDSITTSVIPGKAPIGIVLKEPKTLGQQAARNSKKMGRAKIEDIEAKEKTEKISIKPKKPWWKSEHSVDKIANLSAEQKQKYIMEGKII